MITARFYQRIAQRNVLNTITTLRETQFLPYERIREYQFNKLKKLLNHSYENVPYYRRIFEEIGAEPKDIRNFNDFKRIPILTKEIIRNDFNRLIAKNISEHELIPNSTGGSTGEPLSFYQDHNYELWADAARIRGWYHLAGCESGDTCAILWGAMHEVKEDFSFLERLRDIFKSGEIWLNAFNLSDERKIEFMRWCQFFKPRLLRGYVTAIKDLAFFLENHNLSFPRLKGIIFGAESVDNNTQEYIEKIFGAPSYNTYGGRELSLIAMECSYKNGLHEVSENNYIEFEAIDLVGYKNAGNLIITNLNNYAMPFIRYRIGDIGIPGTVQRCGCGRGLPLIAQVIGRTTEVLVFHDGTRIAGEMFIHLMKDFPLTEYQFVQTSDSRITLRFKRSDKVNDKLKKNIRQTYKAYLPKNVKILFEAVDSFDKTVTGKFRFVLRQYTTQ
jgi:phenylacetate-CoA ligase